MKSEEFALILEGKDLQNLSNKELMSIEGGFVLELFAIAAVAGAYVYIYEAGKAAGEAICYLTHRTRTICMM